MKAILLFAIRLYQRHLSPRKGYACAYRVRTGRAGCSGLGYRAIRRHGAWRGLLILRMRLRRCAQAQRELAGQARRHHAQAGFVHSGLCLFAAQAVLTATSFKSCPLHACDPFAFIWNALFERRDEFGELVPDSCGVRALKAVVGFYFVIAGTSVALLAALIDATSSAHDVGMGVVWWGGIGLMLTAPLSLPLLLVFHSDKGMTIAAVAGFAFNLLLLRLLIAFVRRVEGTSEEE